MHLYNPNGANKMAIVPLIGNILSSETKRRIGIFVFVLFLIFSIISINKYYQLKIENISLKSENTALALQIKSAEAQRDFAQFQYETSINMQEQLLKERDTLRQKYSKVYETNKNLPDDHISERLAAILNSIQE